MKLLSALILLLTCSASQAEIVTHESEEEIAKHNVWHAAKLRGVAFRAIGQEPSWLLEITESDKIFLSTDYGQKKSIYSYVEPDVFSEQRYSVYSIPDKQLTITIKGFPCSDIMSGERFEVSVVIVIGNRVLNGCGRALY